MQFRITRGNSHTQTWKYNLAASIKAQYLKYSSWNTAHTVQAFWPCSGFPADFMHSPYRNPGFLMQTS